MKGLLLKDYYEIRNQFGLIIPLIGVYAVATSFIGDSFMFSAAYVLVGMVTMLLAMLPTSSFAFDERITCRDLGAIASSSLVRAVRPLQRTSLGS